MPGKPAKIKDFKGTLRKLIVYMKPYRWQIGLVVVAAIISVILTALAPAFLGQITTELFRPTAERMEGITHPLSIDFSFIARTAILLIIFRLAIDSLNYFQQFSMARVSQNVVYDLRKAVDQKLARLHLKFVDSQSHG
jgi:ATP-binding cassette subfamily B protein